MVLCYWVSYHQQSSAWRIYQNQLCNYANVFGCACLYDRNHTTRLCCWSEMATLLLISLCLSPFDVERNSLLIFIRGHVTMLEKTSCCIDYYNVLMTICSWVLKQVFLSLNQIQFRKNLYVFKLRIFPQSVVVTRWAYQYSDIYLAKVFQVS